MYLADNWYNYNVTLTGERKKNNSALYTLEKAIYMSGTINIMMSYNWLIVLITSALRDHSQTYVGGADAKNTGPLKFLTL